MLKILVCTIHYVGFFQIGSHTHYMSQWANKLLLNPCIKTSKNGTCGHCDCMVGLGEVVSHIEALFVEAVRCTYTCTELPCPWNVPPSIDGLQCGY